MKIDQFFDGSLDLIYRLFDRWQDEKEYEDWKDYAIPLRKKAQEFGVWIIGMTHRPFGFKAICEGKVYQFTVNDRECRYRKVS